MIKLKKLVLKNRFKKIAFKYSAIANIKSFIL